MIDYKFKVVRVRASTLRRKPVAHTFFNAKREFFTHRQVEAQNRRCVYRQSVFARVDPPRHHRAVFAIHSRDRYRIAMQIRPRVQPTVKHAVPLVRAPRKGSGNNK